MHLLKAGLKYCERCGGLWLRFAWGTGRVLQVLRCENHGTAAPSRVASKPRLPGNHRLDASLNRIPRLAHAIP
jgi:hypothetical protein